MKRIGIQPNRVVAVAIALVLAGAGVITVLAQALGPAGPSPASDNAAVVSQALVTIPEGDTVWRIRNLQVNEATEPITNPYPAFVSAESIPVIVVDEVTGFRQRLAGGEATVILPNHATSILSLGPRQTVTVIDVLPVDEASLSGSSGRISESFSMSGGAFDVDLIRIDLDEGETSTVPMGNGPSQLVARTGQAEITGDDGSFMMAAGSDRLANGDLTITANTDDTTLLIARIGPQIDTPGSSTPVATAEATPAPTEAPATPAPATPGPDSGELSNVLESVLGGDESQPSDVDSDGDGIVNSEEIGGDTDPDNPDTDGDGLNDGDERERGTDPTNPDTDDDGIPDGQEVELGTDPLNSDTDNDVLYDGGELIYGSDPLEPDTDGDGLSDGDEVYFYNTSPVEEDTDGDGVNDYEEVFGSSSGLRPGDALAWVGASVRQT